LKVLLINPGMDLNKFGGFKRFMQPMPPIGLAYLAGVLKENQIEFKVIDDFAENSGIKGICEAVKNYSPTVVGISCLTPSADYVLSIAQSIKSINKQIKVLAGNLHASIFAEEFLKTGYVDIVFHGESEYSFLSVVKSISNNGDLSQIKAISFRDNDKINHNFENKFLTDLDALPYPDWESFPIDKYGFLPFMDINKPALSVLASRGCPFSCSYCSLVYNNVPFRSRDHERVVDEIEFLINRYNVKQIGFVDPIFPCNKEYGVKFCQSMIKRKLNKKIVWISETRIDCVDMELLELMRESGCRRLLFGIETANLDVMGQINKNIPLEKIRKNISLVRKAGIQSTGLFMIGFPSETKKDIMNTIDFANKLELDFAKFAITTPFPGSRLFVDFFKNNKLRKDWENYITYNPDPSKLVSVNEKLTAQELIDLQRIAHRKFYFRIKMIFWHLFVIRTVKLKDMFFGIGSLFFHGKFNKK